MNTLPLNQSVFGHYRKSIFFLLLIGLIAVQIFVGSTLPLHADVVPAGCVDLIRNGSFEAISADWVAQPSTRPPAYIKVNPPLTAVDGVQVVRLGIIDQPNIASNSQIEQVVTLPTNTTSIFLNYRYYTERNGGIDAGDYQYVSIYNVATGQLAAPPLFQDLRADRTWLLGQYNLQQFAGMQLRLVFGVNNDGGTGTAGMYVDNVSMIACSSTPTAIPPTVTNTPIPPPPTATPVVTPSATPVACGEEEILNGNFENVNDGSWLFGQDPIPGRYEYNIVGNASRSVLLGNPRNSGFPDVYSYSSIRQLVTVPANASAVQLSWKHLYQAEGAHDPSEIPCQQVILLSPAGEVVRILENTHSQEGSWGQSIIDISEMRGKSFYVYFNALNDGDEHRTWMYIDDVSLRSCSTTQTAVATATTVTSAPTPTLIPLNTNLIATQVAQAPVTPIQSAPIVQPIPVAPSNQTGVEVPTATGAATVIAPLSTVAVEVAPAADSRMAPNVMADVVVTPMPETASFWSRLWGSSTGANTASVESTTTSSVGLNRLGTVAVLLGILVIIALLASAIVRMLRGR